MGSFPYLGWFSESDAHQYANELRLQGWDVDVRGARAYSTLGWFNDPLLSSMIHKGASGLGYLAEVVLHESVHSTFYIENQSTFNENLADFVGEKLATQYLEEKIGKNSDEYQAWIRSQRRSEEWGKILFGAYHELDKVYSSDFSEQEKKEKKRMTLEQVRTQIQDHREVNNATLMQYRTYQAGVPELEKLWEKSEKKWSVFWGKISEINSNSFKRQQEEDLSSVIRPLLD